MILSTTQWAALRHFRSKTASDTSSSAKPLFAQFGHGKRCARRLDGIACTHTKWSDKISHQKQHCVAAEAKLQIIRFAVSANRGVCTKKAARAELLLWQTAIANLTPLSCQPLAFYVTTETKRKHTRSDPLDKVQSFETQPTTRPASQPLVSPACERAPSSKVYQGAFKKQIKRARDATPQSNKNAAQMKPKERTISKERTILWAQSDELLAFYLFNAGTVKNHVWLNTRTLAAKKMNGTAPIQHQKRAGSFAAVNDENHQLQLVFYSLTKDRVLLNMKKIYNNCSKKSNC